MAAVVGRRRAVGRLGTVIAGSLLLATAVRGAHQPPSPIVAGGSTTWAGLTAGTHAVGFSVLPLPESPAGDGGARVFVWRPVEAPGVPLTVGTLAATVCGSGPVEACFPGLAPPAEAAGGPDLAVIERLRLHGRSGGRPARVRRPLVVLLGSLGSPGAEFTALAEALASRGHIVAEIVAGRRNGRRFDAAAVDEALDLTDRTIATMGRQGDVDVTRIGIVAWSFGGVPATLAAARDVRVRALVSLDSAGRYRYGTDLLRAAGFRAATMRARVLSFTAGVDNTVEKDDTVLAALPQERVERQSAVGLAHAGFCDHYGAWPAQGRPEADRRRFTTAFRAMGERTVAFLATTLGG